MPIILPGLDTKPPLTSARVAMRFAQPKVMPVVTANCPTKLNQPVIQEKNAADLLFGANMAAQKYGPPD